MLPSLARLCATRAGRGAAVREARGTLGG